MFYDEGPGARLSHLTEKNHKEINHFSSGSGTNPFLVPSINEDLSKSVKTSASADQLVDLLTGEVTFSDTISQPVSGPVVHQRDDLLGFLDQHVGSNVAEANHKVSSAEDPKVTDSCSQLYINCLVSLAGPRMVCFNFYVLFGHPDVILNEKGALYRFQFWHCFRVGNLVPLTGYRLTYKLSDKNVTSKLANLKVDDSNQIIRTY